MSDPRGKGRMDGRWCEVLTLVSRVHERQLADGRRYVYHPYTRAYQRDRTSPPGLLSPVNCTVRTFTPNSVNIDTFNQSVCADTLFKRVRMCTAEKTRWCAIGRAGLLPFVFVLFIFNSSSSRRDASRLLN